MHKTTPRILALLCLLLTLGCASHAPTTHTTADHAKPVNPRISALTKHPRAAATAMLNALSDTQRNSATRPIPSPLRKDWHYVPRQREGVMLGDLTTQQKALAHNLLQSALSDAGYLKATDIIWLESVLYELSNQSPGRDPGKYALIIFGNPADDASAWGWRLEGHHLSINLTYTCEGVGVTPLFFGTNPAVVEQGPLAGKRVLAEAHNLAVDFAKSMTAAQREKMMLADKPRDVITGPGREASLGQPVGISVADLSAQQQDALLNLMLTHLDSLEIEHAKSLYARCVNLFGDAPLLEGYRFAWAGPIDSDGVFYYRIHSPRLVIEYSCQNRNHVHAVLHDLADPLQQDLLQRHFEQHSHP